MFVVYSLYLLPCYCTLLHAEIQPVILSLYLNLLSFLSACVALFSNFKIDFFPLQIKLQNTDLNLRVIVGFLTLKYHKKVVKKYAILLL